MNQTKPIKSPGAISVAKYLETQFEVCGKSQAEIAAEVGFAKANFVSMIKNGKTKLPMNKVGLMASAIGVDPLFLFKLVMQEYQPETWEAIQRSILKQPFTTENEIELLSLFRQTAVQNPKIRTDADRKRLLHAFNTLGRDGGDGTTPDNRIASESAKDQT